MRNYAESCRRSTAFHVGLWAFSAPGMPRKPVDSMLNSRETGLSLPLSG